MNKNQKIFFGCAAAAAGALAYLVAPGRSTPEQRAPFLGQNLAHRGLFDAQQGIPENSMAAFRAAAEAGYGVELDVRLTADGEVVVSHDDDLFRMTGVRRLVSESTVAQLQALHLGGTDERIPLFRQVLPLLVGANVPVVVEIKPVARREELCRKTLAILNSCGGHVCVESFDPFAVRWFYLHAPWLLRGQLSSQAKDLGGTPLQRFVVSRVLTNFLCRPQFIAHHIGRRSFPVRVCEWMGAMKVRWTLHNRYWEKGSDAVIFENYRPPVRFK